MTASLGRMVRLTPSMLEMLKALSAGQSAFAGASGRSEHGGRTQTLCALRRRHLVEPDGRGSFALTAAGRALLKTHDGDVV